MIDILAATRENIGRNWALLTFGWLCLACAVFYMSTAALAEHFDSEAKRDAETNEFLHSELGRIPMWTQVNPGKAEIFRQSTPADPDDDIRCLALNIYFEARSESEMGRLAVGHVVMNRVKSARFPDTVCDVVRQGGELRLHRCQFSWWCDGRSDKPINRYEWRKSAELALSVYWGRTDDPTAGALWYHADYVQPAWRTAFVRGPKIGRHVFYSRGPRNSQLASRVLPR